MEFKDLLESTLEEAGRQLGASLDEVSAYMAERSAFLATLVHEPGFERAVRAERDNVALRAGIAATANADAADARIVGVIQGALSMAARAIAGA